MFQNCHEILNQDLLDPVMARVMDSMFCLCEYCKLLCDNNAQMLG